MDSTTSQVSVAQVSAPVEVTQTPVEVTPQEPKAEVTQTPVEVTPQETKADVPVEVTPQETNAEVPVAPPLESTPVEVKVTLNIPKAKEFAAARNAATQRLKDEETARKTMDHAALVDAQSRMVEEAFKLRKPDAREVTVLIDGEKKLFEKELEDHLVGQGYQVQYMLDKKQPGKTVASIYPLSDDLNAAIDVLDAFVQLGLFTPQQAASMLVGGGFEGLGGLAGLGGLSSLSAPTNTPASSPTDDADEGDEDEETPAQPESQATSTDASAENAQYPVCKGCGKRHPPTPAPSGFGLGSLGGFGGLGGLGGFGGFGGFGL